MTLDSQLVRLDRLGSAIVDRIASRRVLSVLVLVLLALATYLPGALRLPPVDRTEIVYASASRDMLARGSWTDPRFHGEALAGKPIGPFWLQIAAAVPAPNAIAFYRLPSLLGVMLAVLATYWLLAPVLTSLGALVAAALVAVTPPFVVEANLAITDGISLAAAVVVQLALLRLYVSRSSEPRRPFAVAFWIAQGLGILVNALAVPLLSLATVVALVVMDRKFGWLRRLEPAWGLPLMALIGSPWLISRAVADGGVPFRGMAFGDLLSALGGAQADKWRAWPGAFVLAFVLGFLPGALLLFPAARGLWLARASALPRFLLAWIAGYLIYLEAISSKPPLYTVPMLFPAAAVAVVLALRASARPPGAAQFGFPAFVWAPPWWLAALFVPGLTGLCLWLAGSPPTVAILIGALLVAVVFAAQARAAKLKLAYAWTLTSVVGFALFLAFVFGLLLPGIRSAWPAPRMAEAIAPLRACAPLSVGVLGFREPSAGFILGGNPEATPAGIAQWGVRGERHVVLVEDRWHDDLSQALRAVNTPPLKRLGCVGAYNVMRGCSLSFSIYMTGATAADLERCRPAPGAVCRSTLDVSVKPDTTRARCR